MALGIPTYPIFYLLKGDYTLNPIFHLLNGDFRLHGLEFGVQGLGNPKKNSARAAGLNQQL